MARRARELLYDGLATEFWHEDEAVYAAYHTESRQVIQEVIQCQEFCYIWWQKVPAELQNPEAGSAWKWWCWLPEPLYVNVERIPRLEDWLRWSVKLSREQLLWMEAFLAQNNITEFWQLNEHSVKAAVWLHMNQLNTQSFAKSIRRACQARELPSRVTAPSLSAEEKLRRAAALQSTRILR